MSKEVDVNNDLGLVNSRTREIAIFRDTEGDVKVEILLQNEDLWLTQERMSDLFVWVFLQ